MADFKTLQEELDAENASIATKIPKPETFKSLEDELNYENSQLSGTAPESVLPEPEPRSFLEKTKAVATALPKGVVTGLTTELPRMLGSAMQFTGVLPEVGKKIKGWAEEKEGAIVEPEREGLERWVYEGAKMLAPSLIPGGVIGTAGRIVLGAGKLLKAAKTAELAGDVVKATEFMNAAKKAYSTANKIGAGGAAGLFGLSQAQQTEDIAKERGIEPGVAPYLTGAIEAAGEYLGTKYLGKMLGLTEGGRITKPALSELMKTLGVEIGTEMGQQVGEAGVEKITGIRPEAEPMQEALEVIGPTTVMTLLTGGLGHVAGRLTGEKKEATPPPVIPPKIDLLEAEPTEPTVPVRGTYTSEGIIPDVIPGKITKEEMEKRAGRFKGVEETLNELKELQINTDIDLLNLKPKEEAVLPEMEIAETVIPKVPAVKQTTPITDLNKTIFDTNNEWGDRQSEIFSMEEKAKPQIDKLKKEMSALKGRGNKEAKVKIQKQIDALQEPIMEAKSILEDEWVRNSQLLAEQIENYARAKGITDEDVITNISDEVLSAFDTRTLEGFGPDWVKVTPQYLLDRAIAEHLKSQPEQKIEEKAHEAATSPLNVLPEPTEAQKEAGNYQKGHINLQGLDISIENPEGSIRTGKTKEGETWENRLKDHYGYIKGTKGKDKDHIDTFIGKNPKSEKVFVVNQIDPDTGKFDEHKVMLGYNNAEEAHVAYMRNYEQGWKGMGGIWAGSMPEFKNWLEKGDTTKRLETDFVKKNPAPLPEGKAEKPKLEHLDFIHSRISAGEAGKRQQSKTGEWFGVASTFPEWFKNKGYGRKDIVRLIDKLKKGESITPRQQDRIDDLIKSSQKEFEAFKAGEKTAIEEKTELETKGKGEIKVDPSTLNEGDKVIKDGVEYTHKGMDEEGRVRLVNNEDIKLDAFDIIYVDKVIPKEEFKLTEEEKKPELPKKPIPQELPLGAEKEALKGPLPSEPTPETPLEKAKKEAEGRKIEEEEKKAQVELPEAKPYSTLNLAKAIKDIIDRGEKLNKANLQNKIAVKFGLKVSEMLSDKNFNKKALEEAFEYALIQKAREIAISDMTEAEKWKAIKDLSDNQINLSIRTSGSIQKQQYSTPVPIAYLMGKYLDLDTGKHNVYEPTAGTGMLVITAPKEQVIANELDEGRLEILKDTGYGKVTNKDATGLNPEIDKIGKVDRVIMNPPFGSLTKSVTIGGFKISKLEHQIALNNLDYMKDDGKAAIIVGGHNFEGMGAQEGKARPMLEADRTFLNYLYSHYNVTHNIDIDGQVYKKQGTTFPIRLITIEGRKATPDKTFAPTDASQVESAKTFDDIKEVLEATPKKVKKLQSTDVAIKRHWEIKADRVDKAEGEADEIIKIIQNETNRQSLLDIPMGENPTVRLPLYLDMIRNNTIPFTEWAGKQLGGGRSRWRENLSDAVARAAKERPDHLKTIAKEYIRILGEIREQLEGVENITDAATRYSGFFGLRAKYKELTDTQKDIRAVSRHSYGFEPDYYRIEEMIKNENEKPSDRPKSTNDRSAVSVKLEDIKREELPDYRNGKDITGEDIKKVFGFASVTYGKYADAKERQLHTNHAFDAMHDLAKRLGIKPSDISLGNTLHLAIGALGHGRFSATYNHNYPHPSGGTVNAINLTKTKGDGTFAHEWAHALDFFMGKTGRFINGLKYSLDKTTATEKLKRFLTGNSWYQGSKNAAKENALRWLKYQLRSNQDIMQNSRFYREALKLDKGKGKNKYWSKDTELFARAFEAYIYDTLEGSSPYLVNEFVSDGYVKPPAYKGMTYPSAEERSQFAQCFDELLNQTEWAEAGPTLKGDAEFAHDRALKEYKDHIQYLIDNIDMLEARAKQKDKELIPIEGKPVITEDKPEAAFNGMTDADIDTMIDDTVSEEFPQTEAEIDRQLAEETATMEAGTENRLKKNIENMAKRRLATGEITQGDYDRIATKYGFTEAPQETKPIEDEPQISAVVKEFKDAGIEGITEALDGLYKLFGGGTIKSFPAGLDKEAYDAARPHFIKAYQATIRAGQSAKDFVRLIVKAFGEKIKPYLSHFMKEVRDGKLDKELESGKITTKEAEGETIGGRQTGRVGEGLPETGQPSKLGELPERRGDIESAVRYPEGAAQPGGVPKVEPESGIAGQGGGERPTTTSGEWRITGRGFTEHEQGQSGLNELQVPYKPKSKAETSLNLTPKNIAQSITDTLDRIEKEHGDIDKYVADTLNYDSIEELHNAFAAEQIDDIAIVLDNFGKGNATIIGSQTGTGKGRIIASIIKLAKLQGLKPIFFTANEKLFTDMHRDLTDIGHNYNPFILHTAPNASIFDSDGNVVFKPSVKLGTLQSILTGKEKLYKAEEDFIDNMTKKYGSAVNAKRVLDRNTSEREKLLDLRRQISEYTIWNQFENYDVIFTTYSQVQKMGNKQQDIIKQLAAGNIVLLDESHLASGESARGEFIRDVIASAKQVLYSSATYAKRPGTMPLYFRTALGSSGMDIDSLIGVMEAGGVPLQQIVASELAEAGQYVRKEMDFSGISFKVQVDVKNEARDIERADKTTALVRRILDFDRQLQIIISRMDKEAKKEGKKIEGKKHTQAGITSASFASKVHNVIGQMLLALKVDTAADEAIRLLKEGKKPLINLSNTMETFMTYFTETGLNVGDPITGNFGGVLKKAIDGTLEYTETDIYGNKTKKPIDLDKIGARSLYNKVISEIDNANIDLPASPIDYIKNKIEKAGYRIGEITGRGYYIDYSGKVPTLQRRSAKEQKDKNTPVNDFNSGRLDAVIFNSSGSTGLSLHASEKFKDQRTRHMIIAQADLNIDTFMQALGRIFRKGQVVNPEYTILQTALPAEFRPAAVLQKKMASLNANTSANAESATTLKDIPEMLNVHGDKVVKEFLEEHHELLNLLTKHGVVPEENVMRQITGKVALLPVAQQKAFYEEVEGRYKDYIEYLNQIGENNLVSRDYNFKAETLEKTKIHQGDDEASPFTSSTYLEKVKVNILKKPFTAAKVKELVEKNKAKFNDNLESEISRKVTAYIQDIRQKYEPDVVSKRVDEIQGSLRNYRHFLNEFKIGQTYDVQATSDYSVRGVLTDIKYRASEEGNPVAGSRLRFVFAVIDPIQQVTISLSQKDQLFNTELIERGIDSDWDKLLPKTATEERHIITGNLLRGFEALDRSGEVITYTNKEGKHKTGILIPRSMKNVEDKFMKTSVNAEQAHQWFKKQGNYASLKTTNGEVEIMFYGTRQGEYTVKVPRGKQTGGKYYLDNDVLALVDRKEFISRGNVMSADVTTKNLKPFLEMLQNKFSQRFLIPKETAQGEKPALSRKPELETFAEAFEGEKFSGQAEDIEDYQKLLEKDYNDLSDRERYIVNNLLAPEMSRKIEREIIRTSRAKTNEGFIADFVRAVDDIKGEKGYGKDELTMIDHPEYTKTVEERLLAGESVSYNTKEFGYDLDPISGRIYVYIRDIPYELLSRKLTGEKLQVYKKETLKVEVDNLTKNWENAPKIEIVQSMNELPEHLQDYIESSTGAGDIEGIFDPKTKGIYLVADNIHSIKRAQTVIFHEAIGHYGLRGVLGNNIKPVLFQAYVANKTEADKIAKQYGFDTKTKDGKWQAAEEMLARMAERNEKSRLLDKVYVAIRDFLRKIGFDIKLSDNDLRVMVSQARQFVEKGTKPLSLSGILAMSKRARAETFYSQLERTIEQKMPNRQSAEDLRNMLTGKVKEDEIKWIGLDDYLKEHPNPTKQEVLDFVRQNRVEIREVEKAGQYGYGTPSEHIGTKFAQWQTPGGENYKEMLLTLPYKTEKAKGYTGEETGAERIIGYKSSHWNEYNVLAHVRMNDRVDAEGKKVLFIEEVQSDWHQEGKRKGYQELSPKEVERWRELDYIAEQERELTPTEQAEYDALDVRYGKAGKPGVPSAPFAKTWHELALKRMLRYASENGYDKLAWTTGEMQAERYDLSKQINSITWKQRQGAKEGVRTIYIEPKEGPEIMFDIDKAGIVQALGGRGAMAFDKKNITDVVGKDIGEQIVKELSGDIHGEGLHIGGEGMKGFYDKILPDFLNKYGKKWGARVEESEIELSPEMKGAYETKIRKQTRIVPSIDITPSMKESVLYEGQAMFKREDSPDAAFQAHIRQAKENPYGFLKDIKNKFILDIPMKDLKKFEDLYSNPWHIAKQQPEFMKILDIQLDREEKRAEMIKRLMQSPTKKRAGEVHELIKLSHEDAEGILKYIVQSDAEQKVFTPEELRAKGMNESQVVAYYSWKRSMEKAWQLKMDTAEELAYMPYEDKIWVEALKDVASGKVPLEEALEMVPKAEHREFKEAIEDISPTVKTLSEYREEMGKLRFYFPRSRGNGDYMIRVYEGEGDERHVIHSERFSNRIEGKRIENKLVRDYSGKEIVVKYEPQTPESIFQDLSSVAMEKFIEKSLGKLEKGGKVSVEDVAELRDAVLRAISDDLKARGFSRHAIRRLEGPPIKGYREEGAKEIFMEYMTGLSGFLTKQRAAFEFYDKLGEIDIKKSPKLFEYSRTYVKDMLRNMTRLDAISSKARSFAFTYYLAGNLKSAAVQFTQNFVTGIPFLARETKGATYKYVKAMKDIAMGNLSGDEYGALHGAIDKGITTDQYIKEITGEIKGKFGGLYERLVDILSMPFSGMEIFNRKSAFLAMYRAQISKGLTSEDAFKKARDYVYDTHYLMGKANMPQWARGGTTASTIGRTTYTFRSFTHNYILSVVGSMKTADGRIALDVMGRSLAFILLSGGLFALPFLDDLLDELERLTGTPYRSKMKKALRGLGGETLERFGIAGLPGLLGVDISGSLRIGLPKPTLKGVEESVYGVYGGLFEKFDKAKQALQRGDVSRALEFASPVFVENVLKAHRTYEKGATTPTGKVMFDEKGKPIKLTTEEAIGQTIGFKPARLSESGIERMSFQNIDTHYSEIRQRLYTEYRLADREDRKKVIKEVQAYNRGVLKFKGAIPRITSKNLHSAIKQRPNKRLLRFERTVE